MPRQPVASETYKGRSLPHLSSLESTSDMKFSQVLPFLGAYPAIAVAIPLLKPACFPTHPLPLLAFPCAKCDSPLELEKIVCAAQSVAKEYSYSNGHSVRANLHHLAIA